MYNVNEPKVPTIQFYVLLTKLQVQPFPLHCYNAAISYTIYISTRTAEWIFMKIHVPEFYQILSQSVCDKN
jgi:hypothetical protein